MSERTLMGSVPEGQKQRSQLAFRDRSLPPALPEPDFVELLARTNFSFLQGASHPEEMVEEAGMFEYRGLGVCDVNGLYGVVRGYHTITSPSHFTANVHMRKDFRYLCGSELILNDSSPLVFLPQDKHGYGDLCRLLTLAKRGSPKGFSHLTLEEVLKRSDHALLIPLPPWNDEQLERMRNAVGPRLFLPVCRDLTAESYEFERHALRLEREGYALFATQRPLMHTRSRKSLLDILTCLYHQKSLEEARAFLSTNAERVLRPLPELRRLWRDRPDLLQKTVEIAELVKFQLSEIRYQYPRGFLPADLTPSAYLRKLTEDGLARKFPNGVPEKVRAQAEKELALIRELKYEDYFLTLHEICEFAKREKILFQGRGSAANSVVCYGIGLTAVDPTKIDLLFERFISKERGEPPDIDIDFEHERREEVIQHIYKKFGEGHAAMVCNVIRFRARLALREVAKVFGVKPLDVNRAVKFMGRDGFRRLEAEPDALEKIQLDPVVWRQVLRFARELYGFPRHLGIHSGGFVITQNPITEMVPVEKATMEGRYVVQWNKDDVNTLGLMKIDLLSLGMLTCLRKCQQLLRGHEGIDFLLDRIPPDDTPTYEMIQKADTVGVFQIESRAQMNTLPRLKPENFYDLVIQIAIIRPGPLQGGMVHPYLQRRAKKAKIDYPHPSLEKILDKTYGVPLFQEQVMQIVIQTAGFSPGEADELRRIMSAAWRRGGVMEGIRQRLMRGLAASGLTVEYSEQIYKTIEGFANYGFPESHSASFALLTYASSYIKRHYPHVFTCGMLNSLPMGFYDPRTLIGDAQRHGVRVVDVDVNRSDWDSTLERDETGSALRLGFRLIFSFPQAWAQRLVDERRRGGEYRSLADLIRRVPLPKALLQKLAASNAFAPFGVSPRDLIWQIEALELSADSFLFSAPRGGESEAVTLPTESSWDEMAREYSQKGLSVIHHPISTVRPKIEARSQNLRKLGYVPYFRSEDLQGLKAKTKVRLAGLAGITQRPPTAKGFCFITLEDEGGFMNIIVPPDVYEKDRMTIYSSSLLEIHGEVEREGAVVNVRASRLFPLDTEGDPNFRAPTPGYY